MPTENPIYYIPGWDENFENAGSRKLGRLRWVPMPNAMDGKGFGRVAGHDRGAELLGAWLCVVEIASKMPVRGVLIGRDGPLDAEDLSAMARLPADVFELAFQVLGEPRIGWLAAATDWSALPGEFQARVGNLLGESANGSADAATPAQRSGNRGKGRVGKGRVRSGIEGQDIPAPDFTTVFTGSDRTDSHGEKKWAQLFVMDLLIAFNLKRDAQVANKRDFYKVAGHFVHHQDCEDIRESLLEMAREKAAAVGLDNPVKAWRAEVGKRYPDLRGRKTGPPTGGSRRNRHE